MDTIFKVTSADRADLAVKFVQAGLTVFLARVDST